jgi:hypothetical protein
MTKEDLIFDWQKSEGLFRDKVVSFVLVAIIFTILLGFIRIRPSPLSDRPSESASVLHFKDDDLGRFWMLQAEEDGPFPGRLELDGYNGRLPTGGIDGSVAWSDYKSELRTISGTEGGTQENLAAKGARVFPSRGRADAKPDVAVIVPRKVKRIPVLVPYNSEAMDWMPKKLPSFTQALGAEAVTASWRFTINLREDGSVRESIPLAGGDDAGQAAMQDWLLGVRFKRGTGDRWLGLRVEFVNQADDGTDAE